METATKPTYHDQSGALVDARYEELKQMLISRQRELMNDLQAKIRSVRDEGSQQNRSGLNPGDPPMSTLRTIWSSPSCR